jgi:hypothetical protein
MIESFFGEDISALEIWDVPSDGAPCEGDLY